VGRFKARRGGKKVRPDPTAAAGEPPAIRPERPPEIFLRGCAYDQALQRLDQQVRAYVRQGRREVLVVHGRGRGSPDVQSILGPAVREWCLAHSQLVLGWRPAQPSWGGDGAMVLELNV
jgi:DNA-nicking Smr family endonuclease